MGVDSPAVIKIAPQNIRVSVKYLCEFTIPRMEANAKAHRPKQNFKNIIFQ
jgi:hypothetical protein